MAKRYPLEHSTTKSSTGYLNDRLLSNVVRINGDLRVKRINIQMYSVTHQHPRKFINNQRYSDRTIILISEMRQSCKHFYPLDRNKSLYISYFGAALLKLSWLCRVWRKLNRCHVWDSRETLYLVKTLLETLWYFHNTYKERVWGAFEEAWNTFISREPPQVLTEIYLEMLKARLRNTR